MTTRTIWLVRHAAHGALGQRLCGRQPGVRLSDDGRDQAQALAARLKALGAIRVLTSPMERARETAQPIAEACGAELEFEPALNEIDFGEWTGAAFEALADDPRWRAWNTDRARTCPPGGESMSAAQARMAAWLAACATEGDQSPLVAVSHADVIRAAVAYVLGLSLHFYDRFEIAPASTTTLQLTDAGPRLLRLNEVVHD